VWDLTTGPFTKSINELLIPIYNKKVDTLYFENDTDLINILNNKSNKFRCRFYGIDMGRFATFKHSYVKDLYQDKIYWRDEKIIFKETL
jgi:hypothetical protein